MTVLAGGCGGPEEGGGGEGVTVHMAGTLCTFCWPSDLGLRFSEVAVSLPLSGASFVPAGVATVSDVSLMPGRTPTEDDEEVDDAAL